MEFNEKLHELRKQKGLTQEELAEYLYVSRTAVSKWESGRGYPNIDSLKAISKFFGITVDDLLSGDELLNIAEEDTKQKASHMRDLVYGLSDISIALFFFLPLLGQTSDTEIQSVSLLKLTEIAPYLKTSYFVIVTAIVMYGIITLSLQNRFPAKNNISLILNILGVLLFIISQQPYAAVFLFIFLIIKILLLKKP